jgi:hypothetical protein
VLCTAFLLHHFACSKRNILTSMILCKGSNFQLSLCFIFVFLSLGEMERSCASSQLRSINVFIYCYSCALLLH